MKTIILPPKDQWGALCQRPELIRTELEDIVRNILNDVKSLGDKAVIDYSLKFDKVKTASLKVQPEEIADAARYVSEELKSAIEIARRNIEKFHSAQLHPEPVTETSQGVKCWRKNVAIEKVGLYIPGGNAPLFSTVLMLVIPAKIAGCIEIMICTPPEKNG